MPDPIERELVGLLSPLERYDELHDRWRTRVGTNACDLGYANAYDGPDEHVLGAMREALASTKSLNLQYTPFGGHTTTRRAVAVELAKQHGEPFGWRDVVLTPGAMAALNVVFRALASEGPGGEVIVMTPCWLDYPLYLANLGLKPVLVPLRRDSFRFDLARIRELMTPATRALVFSQPNNPTGMIASDEDFVELVKVIEASGRKPMIVSDETHRDVAFGLPVPSPVRHYERTCVLYSFGKSLRMQGQRIGYVAVSPRHPERAQLARAFERLCRLMGFCTPTALMQTAIKALVTYKPDLTPFAARRRQVVSGLVSAGYELAPSDATYFLYVRTPEGVDDFEFCERLAKRGVFVLPAPLFHDLGYFRLSVTASQAMIDGALEVLRAEGQSLGLKPAASREP